MSNGTETMGLYARKAMELYGRQTVETWRMHTVANEALAYLRPDEDGTIRLADDAPNWLQELIRIAHEGLPASDSYRLAYIRDALQGLAHSTTLDNVGTEPDMYLPDLLAWAASDETRADYCDSAIGNYGADTLKQVLGVGQWIERRTVLLIVHTYLASMPDTAAAA